MKQLKSKASRVFDKKERVLTNVGNEQDNAHTNVSNEMSFKEALDLPKPTVGLKATSPGKNTRGDCAPWERTDSAPFVEKNVMEKKVVKKKSSIFKFRKSSSAVAPDESAPPIPAIPAKYKPLRAKCAEFPNIPLSPEAPKTEGRPRSLSESSAGSGRTVVRVTTPYPAVFDDTPSDLPAGSIYSETTLAASFQPTSLDKGKRPGIEGRHVLPVNDVSPKSPFMTTLPDTQPKQELNVASSTVTEQAIVDDTAAVVEPETSTRALKKKISLFPEPHAARVIVRGPWVEPHAEQPVPPATRSASHAHTDRTASSHYNQRSFSEATPTSYQQYQAPNSAPIAPVASFGRTEEGHAQAHLHQQVIHSAPLNPPSPYTPGSAYSSDQRIELSAYESTEKLLHQLQREQQLSASLTQPSPYTSVEHQVPPQPERFAPLPPCSSHGETERAFSRDQPQGPRSAPLSSPSPYGQPEQARQQKLDKQKPSSSRHRYNQSSAFPRLIPRSKSNMETTDSACKTTSRASSNTADTAPKQENIKPKQAFVKTEQEEKESMVGNPELQSINRKSVEIKPDSLTSDHCSAHVVPESVDQTKANSVVKPKTDSRASTQSFMSARALLALHQDIAAKTAAVNAQVGERGPWSWAGNASTRSSGASSSVSSDTQKIMEELMEKVRLEDMEEKAKAEAKGKAKATEASTDTKSEKGSKADTDDKISLRSSLRSKRGEKTKSISSTVGTASPASGRSLRPKISLSSMFRSPQSHPSPSPPPLSPPPRPTTLDARGFRPSEILNRRIMEFARTDGGPHPDFMEPDERAAYREEEAREWDAWPWRLAGRDVVNGKEGTWFRNKFTGERQFREDI